MPSSLFLIAYKQLWIVDAKQAISNLILVLHLIELIATHECLIYKVQSVGVGLLSFFGNFLTDHIRRVKVDVVVTPLLML